jgi:cell division protein FtsI (penicillin-binding protein 3)
MAMGAIANGGKLYEPLLVSKVIAPNGSIVSANGPKLKRQAVSPTAARWVADMMTGVVEEGGTGREAYIPGYRVAGKTATAQKANPKTGKYDPDKFVSSFVGFVPAQHPRFVIAVVVDEPWVAHLGGQVAAPIFRSIAMHALARSGVAPSGDLARVAVNFPIEEPALRVYASVAPTPSPDATGPEGAIVPTKTSSAPSLGDIVNIPSVSGLPAREALKLLLSTGLQVQFDGSGVAVAQEPRAGASIAKGGTVHVHLSPG